jgi:hypothetical protein
MFFARKLKFIDANPPRYRRQTMKGFTLFRIALLIAFIALFIHASFAGMNTSFKEKINATNPVNNTNVSAKGTLIQIGDASENLTAIRNVTSGGNINESENLTDPFALSKGKIPPGENR